MPNTALSKEGIQPSSIDTNQATMCHNSIQEIPQEQQSTIPLSTSYPNSNKE